MEKSVLVHEREALEDLVHDVADSAFGKVLFPLLHQLVQVLFHEFKHEEQLVILTNDFLEFDDVGVVHLAQTLANQHNGQRASHTS